MTLFYNFCKDSAFRKLTNKINSESGKNGLPYLFRKEWVRLYPSKFNRNVLYVGLTNDLLERIGDHRIGGACEFTRKYNVKYLMHVEKSPNINEAIQREKQLKNWRREWKFNLIKKENPSLKDLWGDIK